MVIYDKDKWKSIVDTTLSNYLFMEKRLTFDYKFSNNILIYYSIFLIIHSLTAVYFSWYDKTLCEYFSIVVSVVMLACSIINGNANYAQRITKITEAINELKTLKRKLNDMDLNIFVQQYNNVVDNTEFRNDIDFFKTVVCKCKKHKLHIYLSNNHEDSEQPNVNEEVKQVIKYLSEVNPWLSRLKIICKYAFCVILIILPVIIFVLCCIFNKALPN